MSWWFGGWWGRGRRGGWRRGWGFGGGWGRGWAWWIGPQYISSAAARGYRYIGPCRSGIGPWAFYISPSGQVVHAWQVFGSAIPPWPWTSPWTAWPWTGSSTSVTPSTSPTPITPYTPTISEKDMLENEREYLKRELQEIERRLRELGEEKT